MYVLLLSLALGLVVFGGVSLLMGALPAVIPATIAFGLAMFFISRRVSQKVEAELLGVQPLLEKRQIAEAQTLLNGIKARYGRWQFLLSGQVDAQLGIIDYLQLKFDEAMPKLQRGRFRNWTALTCIACIHHRKGNKDKAWEEFEAAVAAGPKEAIIVLVWATLLVRDGKRAEALAALDKGIGNLPDSEILKNLKRTVANKKKVNTKHFPQTWNLFFPEELAQQMLVRGRKGGPQQQVPQPKFGARHAPRR